MVTDAWHPQVNGVVRTLKMVTDALTAKGDHVQVISPADFRSIPCPSYPEIRLAFNCGRKIKAILDAGDFDAVHIATEGPIGAAARSACQKRGIAFTTAYHTKFPEYVNIRTGLPLAWFYKGIRWFHSASSGVMVATKTLYNDLEGHGFKNLMQWSRGVELSLFKPYPKDCVPALNHLPRPIVTYVGRVAVEKNIEAFLALETPGTKLVLGGGPQLAALRRKFPKAIFAGVKSGEDLAMHYAASDVLVFPSKTDTFGLVMLEALAAGVPVAGYPVSGPLDVVGRDGKGVVETFDETIGALSEDLNHAVERALQADPAACRAYAVHFSWENCAALFRSNLVTAQESFALDAQVEAAIAVH